MLQDIHDALRAPDAPAPDHELIVELVFDKPITAPEVRAAIIAAIPDAFVEVETAFGGGMDRFHFARFGALSLQGREARAFQFARELRVATGAAEASPVLVDSFYGAVATASSTGDETARERAMESALISCSTPDNQTYPTGWTHGLINSAVAWSKGNRGETVRVGVIDTGRSRHVELDAVCVDDAHLGGLNLVEPGELPYDTFDTSVHLPNPGHGTLVASVVASRGDVDPATSITTGPGKVTGVAPGAEILPIRAIRSVVDIRQSRIPRAIELAIERDCDVIVMCLGGPTRIASVEAALRRAVAAGIVIVAAAGNCYPFVVFPAAYSRNRLCAAVAAVGYGLKPWGRTARGPAVTVSAPGEDVWGASMRSAEADPTFVRASQGTTLATSTTAGVAALWVASHGGRESLRAHAAQIGTTVQDMFMRAIVSDLSPPAAWNGASDLGAGVVDVAKALAFPLPGPGLEMGRTSPAGADETSSPVDVLRSHVQEYGALAAGEIDDGLADVAAELIWHSYMRGASVRARASGLEGFHDPAQVSPDAGAALASRDELARFVLGR